MLPEWTEGLDLDVPNVARMYDYWLGGSHNFAVDREAAEKVLATQPGVPYMARQNRAFVRRAVRYLTARGIRQFLDLGSGIPTVDSVHEIAQAEAPETRVMYVDIDPVAVVHSAHLVADNPHADILQADIADIVEILDHPSVRAMIDLREPVAVLLGSVLQFLLGETPYRVVDVLRQAMVPGSYLVVSHACSDPFPSSDAERVTAVYDKASTGGVQARSRAEIERFFDGFDLVQPGLVWLPQWRPEPGDDIPDDPTRAGLLAAVARRTR
ncbi:MAG TPA: SAM-dependent methyltransferase [Micromonosporaceae bacterium]